MLAPQLLDRGAGSGRVPESVGRDETGDGTHGGRHGRGVYQQAPPLLAAGWAGSGSRPVGNEPGGGLASAAGPEDR